MIVYYDGPQLLLVTDSASQKFLILACDEDIEKRKSTWLIVPVDEADLKLLRNGELTLRKLIFQKDLVFLEDHIGWPEFDTAEEFE